MRGLLYPKVNNYHVFITLTLLTIFGSEYYEVIVSFKLLIL